MNSMDLYMGLMKVFQTTRGKSPRVKNEKGFIIRQEYVFNGVLKQSFIGENEVASLDDLQPA